jgi:hypothetical protein
MLIGSGVPCLSVAIRNALSGVKKELGRLVHRLS